MKEFFGTIFIVLAVVTIIVNLIKLLLVSFVPVLAIVLAFLLFKAGRKMAEG